MEFILVNILSNIRIFNIYLAISICIEGPEVSGDEGIDGEFVSREGDGWNEVGVGEAGDVNWECRGLAGVLY